jgi:hypothetical protein
MALLFMDSCEHLSYNQQGRKYEWAVAPGVTTTGGRTGGYYGNGYVAKYAPITGDTVIVGFATTTNALGVVLAAAGSPDFTQIYLSITAYGSISVTAGTLLGESAAGVFRSGSWNYIEWKTKLDNSVGTVTVKCNGATVLTLTGKDTLARAETTAPWVRFNFPGGSLDDVYICDGSGAQNNDFLGECRVICLLPQTDAVDAGSNADFTPSTGTDHGALVDEAQVNDDTDYVYSSTVGHIDTWAYPALGYTGTIKGVQLNLAAMKTDSGTRAIASVTRPASTNRVTAVDHYLTQVAYPYWLTLWELNPEDSAAWEVADVDGAEFGVKITV